MNTRVAIVGAGAVGASCAYALALNGSCSEIILYDIIPDIAIGKAIPDFWAFGKGALGFFSPFGVSFFPQGRKLSFFGGFSQKPIGVWAHLGKFGGENTTGGGSPGKKGFFARGTLFKREIWGGF